MLLNIKLIHYVLLYLLNFKITCKHINILSLLIRIGLYYERNQYTCKQYLDGTLNCLEGKKFWLMSYDQSVPAESISE